MIVLHVAALPATPLSGLHISVPGLVAAQNELPGVRSGLSLVTGAIQRPPHRNFPLFGRPTWRDETGDLDLPSPFSRPDVVVFHSTYVPRYACIGRELRRSGIPYIICPRGGMTRFIQRHKWWKKRLGNAIFFRRLVAGALAVHCLTEQEARESFGWRRPVFVVGNGMDLPADFELASPGRGDGLRLVFIGRLDVRVKGLDLLLDAAARVRPQMIARGAAIEIYGPCRNGNAEKLAAQIRKNRLEQIVSLPGPVQGDRKHDALKAADVFVHTSRSEGHPLAVLEALSYGVPCLLTPQTSMATQVVSAGAGWAVALSPTGIAEGIQRVLALPAVSLAAAGHQARRLAVDSFSWEEIARATVGEYQRLLAADLGHRAAA
jgi:glycosyltransferase involved in cell wall biosynthesis